LFDTYIARMFNRKSGERHYEDEDTGQKLSWLARNMQFHNQEVFLIEGLQPSWLQTRLWLRVYTVASRMFVGLSSGLSSGLIVGLSNGLGMAQSDWRSVWLSGQIGGLLGGLAFSIIDILRLEWLDTFRDRKVLSHFWWSVIYTVTSVVLICVLVFFWPDWLIVGMSSGLISVPVFWIRGIRNNLANDIQTVEVLRWHWNKVLKGGLIGWIIGVLVVLIGWFFYLPSFPNVGTGQQLLELLIDGLAGGLAGGLISSVFSGLNPEIITAKTTPNQGIRLSTRNALYGGLIIGLIGWMIVGLIPSWFGGFSFGLIVGLIVGLVGVLWYGGLDVIQHYILRLLLIIQGHTPRNYARFLDYAVDRIFLQKVGGGYRFIHRMLLEHFAEMGEEK